MRAPGPTMQCVELRVRADDGAVEHDRAVDVRARADLDVAAEHAAPAHERALGDARAGADERRADDAAGQLRAVGDARGARRRRRR